MQTLNKITGQDHLFSGVREKFDNLMRFQIRFSDLKKQLRSAVREESSGFMPCVMLILLLTKFANKKKYHFYSVLLIKFISSPSVLSSRRFGFNSAPSSSKDALLGTALLFLRLCLSCRKPLSSSSSSSSRSSTSGRDLPLRFDSSSLLRGLLLRLEPVSMFISRDLLSDRLLPPFFCLNFDHDYYCDSDSHHHREHFVAS